MRSPRLVVTTILAVGLLAGSGLGAAAQDEPDATYYELVGSGAYEGLSAVIFEREAERWSWNGVIMPGPLPPER